MNQNNTLVQYLSPSWTTGSVAHHYASQMQAKDFGKKFPGKLAPIGNGLCAFVPSPLPNKVDFLGSVKNEHERALIALGKLGAIIPTLPNPELLTQPFMRREAVLSSKIEGT